MAIYSFNFKTCGLPGLVFQMFHDGQVRNGWNQEDGFCPKLDSVKVLCGQKRILGTLHTLTALGRAVTFKLPELGQLQGSAGKGSIKGIEYQGALSGG